MDTRITNNSTIKWGLYENLRPCQIEAIINEKAIAYLPWGAIEYHGKHNPVGLDSIKLFICVLIWPKR